MTVRLEISSADLERYRHMVSGVSLSDDQKNEIIRIVGGILQTVIDQSFGIDPVVQIHNRSTSDSFQAAAECYTLSNGNASQPNAVARPAERGFPEP